MTRGKIAVALEEKMLVSVEFNGDMYIEDGGHGRQVLDELEDITTEQEYREFIQAFDDENFNYATESIRNGENYFNNQWHENGVEKLTGKEETEMYNFCDRYFDKWFSDYVYLKNLTQDYIVIECDIQRGAEKINGVLVEIEPNGIAVLYFGTLVEQYSTNYKILTEIKEEKNTFDGYWEMTENGIIIYDTDNDREFSLTCVDDVTIDHIVEYVREGYVRGDLYEVNLESV